LGGKIKVMRLGFDRSAKGRVILDAGVEPK
jgi:hypothetical protein